jgi:hypothetical protein
MNQWIRKVGLYVVPKVGDFNAGSDNILDLSQFRVTFEVQNADIESPNNAVIRVYNLAYSTAARIRKEYSGVLLNAGYEDGNYGIIFRGTIKQFKLGRENGTDWFLDIFAADGDIAYNQGFTNTSLAKGATNLEIIQAAAKAMPENQGVEYGEISVTKQNFPNIRGTVLLGMARATLRNVVTSLDAGWSIQNGKVLVISNTGFRDDKIVEINALTGMIGVPEQTEGGIKVRCLLNSKIRIGGRIRLNNKEITQKSQQDPNGAATNYSKYAQIEFNAAINNAPDGDGVYRTFTVEHEGDSRGTPWYTTLICLSVNETNNKTTAN